MVWCCLGALWREYNHEDHVRGTEMSVTKCWTPLQRFIAEGCIFLDTAVNTEGFICTREYFSICS